MRLLLVLLAVFIAVTALGFWTNHLLESATAELVHDLDGIASQIKQQDWEYALAKTRELEKDWEKKAGWWPALLDHQEMDNIKFALARFKEYVAARDSALARGQLSELREMIMHIPEKEALSLKNLF